MVIALVPLLLATVFGGLRIQDAITKSTGIRLAASRADVIPAIPKYMAALDAAVLARSSGRDLEQVEKTYAARKRELQARLADTDVVPDVRVGLNALLTNGQALVDRALGANIGLRELATTYGPILLTAEDAINASVRVDNEWIRGQVQGLSRTVGARGQMTLQQILVTRGGEFPAPQLRTAMTIMAGTEPSTLFGMSEVLGVGSQDAKTLQQQMVSRMAIMSDPDSVLVENPDLLRSIQITAGITEHIISQVTESVIEWVQGQTTKRRDAAVQQTMLVLGAIAIVLVLVVLVARALVGPLRMLRDGALQVAHTDLENEISRVRAGAEPVHDPLAVYTTEEIGQVAHAVDELHTQALLIAGDEARLRLLVNDMFETMSRRSRSLIDQQLSVIDRLERGEEDPEQLDKLFRLDHLAARLRRNSTNLLVLAGAQISRDQRDPLSLATVITAAMSEVEDYRRVEAANVADCTVIGAAAGSVIHLVAELMDNALRYSPPTTLVEVLAVRSSDGGVMLRIVDSGLGMNDADRRIANMRLQAGGEVNPDNARHMGLFVVGRLASRHGIWVELRVPAPDEAGCGTTAEIYLPPAVLVDGSTITQPAGLRRPTSVSPLVAELEPTLSVHAVRAEQADPAQPEVPVTLLPRRNPGSSGITDVPAPPTEQQRPRRELATPWWEIQQGTTQESNSALPPVPATAASDTSAFFASRSQASAERQAAPSDAAAESADVPTQPPNDDVIYQRMLSEMSCDPHELGRSADLDWRSVWDRGWTAAAEAEDKPVESLTDQGLPVRTPGARLVPGAALSQAEPDPQDQVQRVGSTGATFPGPQPQRTTAVRDPGVVRASMSNHFGGVRVGRLHARESNLDNGRGPDKE